MTDDPAVRRVGGKPLSQQARAAILESIIEGRFEDGRIPSEQELCDMLGVSRTTVRAALQSLEQDGLIVRARGRGTRVRAHASSSSFALQRLISFSTLLREAGYDASLEFDWELSSEPNAMARSRLGSGASSLCYVITRVFYADGQPAILVEDTVPQAIMRKQLNEADNVPQSIFELSERFFQAPIDYAVVDIVARVADTHVARELDIDEGTSIIDLLETHYAADDTPLAFSEIHVRQDFVRFSVVRRP